MVSGPRSLPWSLAPGPFQGREYPSPVTGPVQSPVLGPAQSGGYPSPVTGPAQEGYPNLGQGYTPTQDRDYPLGRTGDSPQAMGVCPPG